LHSFIYSHPITVPQSYLIVYQYLEQLYVDFLIIHSVALFNTVDFEYLQTTIIQTVNM